VGNQRDFPGFPLAVLVVVAALRPRYEDLGERLVNDRMQLGDRVEVGARQADQQRTAVALTVADRSAPVTMAISPIVSPGRISFRNTGPASPSEHAAILPSINA
jgi:hypothetical protein